MKKRFEEYIDQLTKGKDPAKVRDCHGISVIMRVANTVKLASCELIYLKKDVSKD